MNSYHLNISAAGAWESSALYAGRYRAGRPGETALPGSVLPGMDVRAWSRMVEELQERVQARIDIFLSTAVRETKTEDTPVTHLPALGGEKVEPANPSEPVTRIDVRA